VSHDPTTKETLPNPAPTYTTTIEGESDDAKENTVNPMAEDKR